MATGRQVRARSVSLARLRRWLLAGVVLLLLVIGGLLGYAHHRARRMLADLPGKLGLHIQSETDGFTLSQSVKGRTVFTLHAAKAVQHENGKTTLHNVAITLYGPVGSNQTDSIRGDDFEYDQPNGVIQTVGEVHLDLANPAQASAASPKATAAARRIAVTTRGLVYLQKLGVAATDEPLQIVYGDLRGTAVGADYDSDQGMLRLRKDVHMDGMQNGKALRVAAADAELDRTAQTAKMHAGHVETGGSIASGDLVTIHMAKDGTIQSVNAEGHAMVTGVNSMQAFASRLLVHMNAAGKPQTTAMDGDVHFKGEGSSGSAQSALLQFNAGGQASQIDLLRNVHIDGTGASGEQDALTADRVVGHLLQDGRRTALRDAVASGNAVLRTVSPVTSKEKDGKAFLQTTLVHANELHAVTTGSGSKRYIASLDGAGSTRIDQSSSTGEVRSSSGDSLHATLRPAGSKADPGAPGQLQTAVQTGHVVVTQHVPASAAKVTGGAAPVAQDTRATAQRAEFDGASQRLLLTGTPVVSATGVQLAADRISLSQVTGDTEATGAVKGTFVQAGTTSSAADPTHVLAERAVIAGAGGTAHFFGGSRPARMWSSTAQLDAPELELDRTRGTLAAHGASGASAVHLTLPPNPKSAAPAKSGTVQITGQQLTLTSATAAVPGQLVVTGQAHMHTAATNVSAQHLLAVLHPDAKKQSATGDKSMAMMSSSIESVTATGDVLLQQPGRTGSGAKLLYTAADGRYQLTGTPAAPPRIADSARGSITGTSLIFRDEDDSVEVAGEPGHRVHTETEAGSGAHSR